MRTNIKGMLVACAVFAGMSSIAEEEVQVPVENVEAAVAMPAESAEVVNASASNIKEEAEADFDIDNEIDDCFERFAEERRNDPNPDNRDPNFTYGKPDARGRIYYAEFADVNENAASAHFPISRTLAFTKAYQKVLEKHVKMMCATHSLTQVRRFFNDESSDMLLPATADAADVSIDRMKKKIETLAEAKVDAALRDLGVDPATVAGKSLVERRKRLEDSISIESVTKAVSGVAGLVPVRTIEIHDKDGNYLVGVIAKYDPILKVVSGHIRSKTRPALCKPEVGIDVRKLYAGMSDEKLLSQFGVRFFYNENGMPTLVAFGQDGSSYLGEDRVLKRAGREQMKINAEDSAHQALTAFINGAIAYEQTNRNSEAVNREIQKDLADGTVSQINVPTLIKRITDQSAELTAKAGMIGRSIVFSKNIKHSSGRDIRVTAVMWSFEQLEAMQEAAKTPVITQPRKVAPPARKTVPRTVESPVYDF